MKIADEILTAIRHRQSSRVMFDPDRPIPREALVKIMEAARWAPTPHNMQNFELVLVDDHDMLKGLSNIEHDVDETFLRENYQQLSFSQEELLRKKTGILGSMFPASWRTPGVKPDPNEPSAHAFLGGPVQKCAALLVVVYDPSRRAPASEHDALGMMSLGCVMENMWLMAEALGIGFHILSALGTEGVEAEAKLLLQIPPGLKIAYAARLGYPLTSPKYLRVRRDLGGFVHHNRYGVRFQHGVELEHDSDHRRRVGYRTVVRRTVPGGGQQRDRARPPRERVRT